MLERKNKKTQSISPIECIYLYCWHYKMTNLIHSFQSKEEKMGENNQEIEKLQNTQCMFYIFTCLLI